MNLGIDHLGKWKENIIYGTIMVELRYIHLSLSERYLDTILSNFLRKEGGGKHVFKLLRKHKKQQDKGKSHYDIDRDCKQLCVSSFSNEREHSELPTKSSALK